MGKSASLKLNNGYTMPILGLGTWQTDKHGECGEAVRTAIDVGYRHFDCAAIYRNEAEVGEALNSKIKDGVVSREDLFITSKLWNDHHDPDDVVQTGQESLSKLGFTYLDLYLIHWPFGIENISPNEPDFSSNVNVSKHSFVDTWRGMEECVKLGLTKSIGVSNFNHHQINTLLNSAIQIQPVVNQIEVHPNLQNKKLIQFCKSKGIEIVAYSPLGSPDRPWQVPGDPNISLDDPGLVAIGKKLNKTSAQIILRYLVELGACPIPKSTNKQRLMQNIDIFDIQLGPEDKAYLEKFECNGRICPAAELKDHPDYPFHSEF